MERASVVRHPTLRRLAPWVFEAFRIDRARKIHGWKREAGVTQSDPQGVQHLGRAEHSKAALSQEVGSAFGHLSGHAPPTPSGISGMFSRLLSVAAISKM